MSIITMPFEMLGNFPLGTLLGLAIIAFYAYLAFLILGISMMIDTASQPIYEGKGTVLRVSPILTDIYIIVEINDKIGYTFVKKNSLVKPICRGDKVAVDYIIGQLSKKIYITDIYKVG